MRGEHGIICIRKCGDDGYKQEFPETLKLVNHGGATRSRNKFKISCFIVASHESHRACRIKCSIMFVVLSMMVKIEASKVAIDLSDQIESPNQLVPLRRQGAFRFFHLSCIGLMATLSVSCRSIYVLGTILSENNDLMMLKSGPPARH